MGLGRCNIPTQTLARQLTLDIIRSVTMDTDQIAIIIAAIGITEVTIHVTTIEAIDITTILIATIEIDITIIGINTKEITNNQT